MFKQFFKNLYDNLFMKIIENSNVLDKNNNSIPIVNIHRGRKLKLLVSRKILNKDTCQ